MLIEVDDVNDPRLIWFSALKERELAREGEFFIAEGELVVRRLLDAHLPCPAILLDQRRVAKWADQLDPATSVYVLSADKIRNLIGYRFHSGLLAVGRRKDYVPLEKVLAGPGPLKLLVCPEIANAENLGSLMRLAAGFGVDALVLGERCCDPWYRQAVRVSMGAVFQLPLVKCQNLLEDMRRLAAANVHTLASVLDTHATPLEQVPAPPRWALLVGNEAQGLDAAIVQRCAQRITIPMQLQTDSLNVAVATGICLYHLTRLAG